MANPSFFLAGPKGLEPSPSGVTGRRYNQLNYDPVFSLKDRTHLLSMFNYHIPTGKINAFVTDLVGGTGLEPVTSTV